LRQLGSLTSLPVQPCQSLFVAPCSHTWHYKCIRVIINGPHWPHFICPNCRTVADLEAELDDPYADGEWEEVEAADANFGIQSSDAPGPTSTARQSHLVDSSEATNIPTQPELELDQDRTGHNDGDVVEASDDSDMQRIEHTAEAIDCLNLDESPFPPSSSISEPHELSNATVPPVDIISRKAVPSLSAGTSSRLEEPEHRTERSTSRTPSPNGLPYSVTDAIIGAEGPMTPRNDAGPFVLDGSAGRLSDIRLAAASVHPDAATDTAPQPGLLPSS
jgi:hypothetical protein